MFKQKICIIFLVLFVPVFGGEESTSFISNQSLHNSMELMLEYHVEYKSFSSLLAKRSLKTYIEQFDPYKMYLTQNEADVYIRITEKKLQEVVEGYKHESYKIYEELNSVIQTAILRAREIRKSLRPQLLKASLALGNEETDFYPKNLEDLKKKINKRLVSFLGSEKKSEEVSDFTQEQRTRLLDLWEERLQRLEKPYLERLGSYHFPMHVLKAFAKSLDAHSSFFSMEEAYDLKMALEKQFEGIGIVLREGLQGVVIKSLIKNGPAEKIGQIQKGDVLLAVDGKSVVSLPYEDVLARLKGDKGQKVTLLLKRGEQQPFEVAIIREKIVMEDERVHYSTAAFDFGTVGKIDIPSFYESEDGTSCAGDLKEAIAELRSQGPLAGLVIDMRENSGGFLSQAVKVSGLFMSGGVVVVSKYYEGQMQYLRNTDGKIFYQGPLVILTSKASASAAEIVAQALQDYGIAVIVGDRRTYGKGTIQYQTVTGKDNASYFKVTVGRYYTVSGRSTQIEGVRADIRVPTLYAPFNIGEKYLSYPLKNDQIESVFIDPLIDVTPRTRSWMQKNYLPYIQKKLSFWSEMMPQLKKNSEERLRQDKDFQRFLKAIQSEKKGAEIPEELFGEMDVQMAEAVRIVKDMVFLEQSRKNALESRK